MKKLMMMFAAGAALTAAAALPEVRDTASKPLVPKTEFDFSAEVTSPQLWIETADGGRRTVAQAQSGGVLRLAPGETLVMDAALLPPILPAALGNDAGIIGAAALSGNV